MDRANSVRGAKGSIAGTHYDPTSATANRGASKKRRKKIARILFLYYEQSVCVICTFTKGQLISKGLFVIFT